MYSWSYILIRPWPSDVIEQTVGRPNKSSLAKLACIGKLAGQRCWGEHYIRPAQEK